MLTQDDINKMESLTSHPVIAGYTQAQDWTSIALWYEAVPAPQLHEIISYMTPLDKYKYFQYINFQEWYSQFNLKLHNNTALEVLGYTIAQINYFSTLLLVKLVEVGLTGESMQDLVNRMFSRQLYEALYYFLVCLGSDGVFESQTLQLYAIEMSQYPRWQTIGLSASPTYSECQDIYST